MAPISDRLATALADRYRIERILGKGGMATVYLARDARHDRDVAIKVLNAELAESLGRQRFVREIRMAAKLNHPHILPLYDSGEARPEGPNGPEGTSFLYFVMPVMQGQTLRDRLETEHTLPVDEAVRIATEVDTRRALELFEWAVDHGFYLYRFFAEWCPFVAPLRGMPEFDRIVAKAARRVAEFSA